MADPEKAWRNAKALGWTCTEVPIDHTGHVSVTHYCPRHARTTRALTFAE